MMNWLISLSLTGLLMLNSGMKLAEVVNFFAHRADIAATLCVERDVPGSCCAGSCQVAQRAATLDGAGAANDPQVPAPRPLAQVAPMKAEHWDWRSELAALLGLQPRCA